MRKAVSSKCYVIYKPNCSSIRPEERGLAFNKTEIAVLASIITNETKQETNETIVRFSVAELSHDLTIGPTIIASPAAELTRSGFYSLFRSLAPFQANPFQQ